ncbi:MAG TPA: DUF2336 domain-containing protein [Sphingomonas sp.]|jgi:hypothetical protein|uniref:DUF2336 domain-containing protein n=1 Tax=Sphingomonas sp. TaxID=28214 RepID=UPI002ED9342E
MDSVDSLAAPAGGPPSGGVLADAARAARTGRIRLEILARDLFRTDDVRIDEARRTRMRAMLDGLVRATEGRLRRDLVKRLEAAAPASVLMALGNMTLPIARPVLESAGTLADADLVAALARRVDEHRLVVQARVAAMQDPTLVARGLFAGLLVQANTEVANAARQIAELTAARFGPFEEPALGLTDLAEAVQVRLVWRVAAAVRHWIDLHDRIAGAVADRAVAAAGAAMLADTAARPGLDRAAMALARGMLRAGIADDEATVALAAEGQVAVAVASLALRVGIGMAAAWDMVLDPDGARLVLLLRAAGLERSAAAALLLRWPDAAAPVDRIGDRMAGYDMISHADAHAAIDLHRLDPAYAAALDALASGMTRQ